MLPDDIEAMLASRTTDMTEDVATPEDAVRHLLPQLLANEPYVITHGDVRAEYEERRAEIDRAFDRMEQLQRRSEPRYSSKSRRRRRSSSVLMRQSPSDLLVGLVVVAVPVHRAEGRVRPATAACPPWPRSRSRSWVT